MRWILHIIVLCCAMLVGIFFGIDQAEQNMHAVLGTEGAPRAFEVSVPEEEGKVEITVFGHEYETRQPVEEEHIERGQNFLSHLGNKIGEGLEWAARKTLDRLFELIDKLLL